MSKTSNVFHNIGVTRELLPPTDLGTNGFTNLLKNVVITMDI